jgi:large subunit ribosomal protein L32e
MKDEKKPRTSSKESTLRKRKLVKGRKPDFKRQESWRYKRVKKSWRRPRGKDSKMRKKVKGWPSSPQVGYRSPKETRGLHPSGYEEVLVRNVDDVRKVNPKTQSIRIASKVGARKRVEIAAIADELSIHVLNPRRVVESEEEIEELKELEQLSDEEEREDIAE